MNVEFYLKVNIQKVQNGLEYGSTRNRKSGKIYSNDWRRLEMLLIGGASPRPGAGPLAGLMGLNIGVDIHSLANIFYQKLGGGLCEVTKI